MKLNLVLTILVVVALIVAAALTLRAVIASQGVIYRGEALQDAADRCTDELTVQRQDRSQVEIDIQGQNSDDGIDCSQQDISLRPPRSMEYAYMVLRPQLFKAHQGGCDGYPLPDLTD